MKHLLQHFKTLTKHPQNAEELKGLIVRLALRGKLSEKWREENPDVEYASELFEKIIKSKEELIEKRKLKLRKIEEKKVIQDMKYAIPNSWEWYKFSDVVFFQEGPGIRKWQFRESGVKLLNVQNIVGDTLVLDNTDKHVEREEFQQKYQHFKVEEGDLLFASSGGSWGKSAWFVDPGYDVMLNTSMVRMCFYGKDWFPSYLKTFISSGFFVDQMSEQLVGIQPNFGSTHLSRIYIPIPPLEEQKAIVTIVNELFAEVEQLEEQTITSIQLKVDFVTSALQRLSQAENINQEWQFLQTHFTQFFTEKENVKQLRETILQLALQGKLTSKWRTCHPELIEGSHHASELLKRIQTEKQQLIAQKKIKKEKPLPPIEDHEKPYDLPDGWVWCRWIDLLAPVKYPMKRGPFGSSLRKADFVSEGIRVFEQYNPINDDPNWMRYFITEEKYEKMKAFTANEGDFLISCSGATLGRIVYLPKGTMPGIINQALLKLTLSENVILSEYFLKLFRSFYLQEKIWGKAKGMAQPNMVGVKELKNILIPLPPLEEQKAIVKQVNSLMALCDSLEEHIDNGQTQIEQLMQSCLREVFK